VQFAERRPEGCGEGTIDEIGRVGRRIEALAVDLDPHAARRHVVVGREHPEADTLPGRLVEVVEPPDAGGCNHHEQRRSDQDQHEVTPGHRGDDRKAEGAGCATLGGVTAEPEGLWETHASWWQDGFTDGVDPEYVDQIIPLASRHLRGARRLLDVGTGEGQVARQARQDGVGFVVGIDPTRAQIDVAAQRGGDVIYGEARADRLPFGAESFDAVVACLVFEHIDAMETAIAEVARVLEPGGRFLLFLNHPLIQTPESGWIDDHMVDPPEQYWRVGPYLTEQMTIEEVEPGVSLPFVHRPLGRYVNTMSDHGLLVERMEEPEPPPEFLEQCPGYEAARAIPRLLLLVARKVRI